jgi:small subunit ribosomal protein S2
MLIDFEMNFNKTMKEKLKAMLETGVHFGHQVRRWNAKMAPYIYEEKNGIHILDIVQTVDELEKARIAFKKAKNVVFVGTRPQIAPVIKNIAEECNAHYVNTRWVGGLLTNWSTISAFFGGVRQLSSLPDLVVIVGQPHERNAVLECQKLNIPTITLLDSNCDPSYTTYGIPANDDSTRSVEFILKQLVS